MSGERTMEHICRLCGAVRRSTRAIEDCQAERPAPRPALRLVPKAPEPKPPRVPNVSEHAKLRLVQYLYGINPDAIERAILTDTVRRGILAGANFITRPDGLRLPIAPDGDVVAFQSVFKEIPDRPLCIQMLSWTNESKATGYDRVSRVFPA